jgi:hypothetical protein
VDSLTRRKLISEGLYLGTAAFSLFNPMVASADSQECVRDSVSDNRGRIVSVLYREWLKQGRGDPVCFLEEHRYISLRGASLQDQIQSDFRNGKTFMCLGFLLSETEAAFLAAANVS